MTENEKLVDRLGQIAFRVETNLSTLGRYISQGKDCQPLMTSLFSDVEKLKQLKLDLAKAFEDNDLEQLEERDRESSVCC